LSTNSAHRVIDGATHEGLIAEEGRAAVTTRAILDVVSRFGVQRRWPSELDASGHVDVIAERIKRS
jgi:hypothetical protein